MGRRLPSTPPVLGGYTHLRAIGKGGFADVFLYEQALPRAEVAVKVLLPDVASNSVRAMFLSEANLMSQLATHPSVVTVHAASIAPDGRPYLVMEYCPSSYGSRYKTERISLAEVLKTGVRIGSALESAHRQGFLHRDIKPSNILLTRYNHPVLADFGIAATLAEAERDEAEGMSVPWSAPEVLQSTSRGTVRSEVWSLSATLYTMLAGRSPFEYPGKGNTRDELQRRIVGRDRVQPTGRPDVPAELEALLAAGLDKDPAARPASVLDVVRGLQLIESTIGLPQTSADIAAEASAASSLSARPVSGAPVVALTRAARGGVSVRAPGEGRLRHRGRAADEVRESTDSSVTVIRQVAPPRRRAAMRPGAIVAVSGGAVVLLAVIATAVVFVVGGRDTSIPVVSDVQATVTADAVEFAWKDPGLAGGDVYVIRSPDGRSSTQSSNEFTVQPDASGTACVTVRVSRDGRVGEPSAQKCASTADAP
ncbi:serine/threonine-protein kinase [Agreia sp. COWG]|uniref:serine/threonine-protein kinase n=1 Tax=Agreia sp. COWG TaxID=2773266 RepID=UPI0019281BEA|nr:serine/threonine-protein kinase [Agreia sp. COWG]CAD6004754.1 Serine/threonine protein kinase [Agreia sp. COWG]